MHKKRSSKFVIARRAALYAFMSTAVVVLVTVLVFIMLGYQFNRKDGRIEQGGLVQLGSRPSGAKISIDGNETSMTTSNKATLTRGKHTIEFSRDGYQTWKKDIQVAPSSVQWLTYARMVPQDKHVQDVATLEGLGSSRAAGNGQRIVAIEHVDKPELTMFRLDRQTPERKVLTLPTSSFTDPAEGDKNHHFRIESWDRTSRYVLVQHTYGTDGREWIVVDTDDVTQTRNATTLLGVPLDKVQFSVGDSHILYAVVDGSLRKINLNDATLSRPLVTHIAEFEQFDRATVVYSTLVNPDTKQRTVGYYTDNAKTVRTVRSYADDGAAPLRFRIAEYYGDKYYLIQYSDAVEALKGDLPSSDSDAVVTYTPVTSLTTPGGFDQLYFSPNGRFIVAQKAGEFTTYDLEMKQLTRTTLQGTGETSKLRWMDTFNLLSDRGGTLRSYDYDGLNPREYMTVIPGQALTLSPNDKYLYALGSDKAGKPTLRRATMVLD